MGEEVDRILDGAEEAMDSALQHLKRELSRIRAGRASPVMLSGVYVDCYGSRMPLSQLSNIHTPDARTISVQPWEKNLIDVIEKAIADSDLGLNPNNKGDVIIISLPTLTEERRKALIKQVKKEAEEAKVSIRNARKAANAEVKALVQSGLSADRGRRAAADIQARTDIHIERINGVSARKESDIMKV